MFLKRVITIQLVFSILISSIAIRLVYLQVFKNKEYENIASNMWQRSFPIVASRGSIYDRNNIIFARNIPTYSLSFVPYQIKDKESVASKISNIIDFDYKELLTRISSKTMIVRLNKSGRNISEEKAKQISSLNLEGVYVLQDSKRYYPYDNMLSNVLGFSGIDNQGLAGIEAYYDKYLKGENGSLNYYMDAKGGLFNNLKSNLVSPIPGLSIHLTIDYNLQAILERELNNAFIKYEPNSILGIIANPSNGEILAMSNYPNYNPNEYSKYDPSLYNFNLSVFKSYEPGSTFKVFSFASAINEGLIDIYKDTYYDKGYEIVDGSRIKSWKKGGHGLQTYLEVLQNSSNPGFVNIARKLGKDNLFNYVNNFGFGMKTGIDILGETSGIMFSYDKFNEIEQATTSFGHAMGSLRQLLLNY